MAGDTLVDRLHHEIEIMTRRLELEKRRLKRLDKELEAAQKTHMSKETQARQRQNAARAFARPKSGGADRARATTRPKSSGPARAYNSQDLKQSQDLKYSQDFRQSGPLTARAEDGSGERMVPMRQLVAQMDVQVKKLNSIKNENERLQLEVQTIRKRKRQLALIFEKLKFQIRGRTEQIRDFVEEAAQSKAVSSEAEQRVEVMRHQRDDERKQFTEEVLRIRKDMKKLELEKREVQVRLKRVDKGVQRKNELILPPEEEDFSEPNMMRRIMKTAFLNCIQRRHIKQHQKSIEIFEQAFATIKQSTGISNIEEIVKIFVALESRNYSLLTYVNHMNRDIEALEGLKRARRQAEMTLRHKEVTSEKTREHALGDMQKKLRATRVTIEESREACDSQREVVRKILPLVAQVSRLLDAEAHRLHDAGPPMDGSDFPKRPADELRPESVLLWLQWVEDVLTRFRDLLPVMDPATKEACFPATAAGPVKQLQPKRHHQPAVPVVKLTDLPTPPLLADDHSTQKRSAAMQKAEADEDSEEEGFDERPLMLKEIRSRAEMARSRKGRSRSDHRPSNVGFEDSSLTGSFPLGRQHSPQAPSSHLSDMKTGSTAPDLHGSHSRRSVGFTLGSTDPGMKLEEGVREAGDTGRGHEDASSDAESRSEAATPLAKQPKSALNQRVRQLIQVAALSRPGDEVTKDELDITFLRKYNMSRQELEVLANRMGMSLAHLCFLKNQFDIFDQDQSGYVSSAELRGLFSKLGEDILDKDLEEAVKELDSDESGEIEFFEFVEWFCS